MSTVATLPVTWPRFETCENCGAEVLVVRAASGPGRPIVVDRNPILPPPERPGHRERSAKLGEKVAYGQVDRGRWRVAVDLDGAGRALTAHEPRRTGESIHRRHRCETV